MTTLGPQMCTGPLPSIKGGDEEEGRKREGGKEGGEEQRVEGGRGACRASRRGFVQALAALRTKAALIHCVYSLTCVCVCVACIHTRVLTWVYERVRCVARVTYT
jgi:hypothetical protein